MTLSSLIIGAAPLLATNNKSNSSSSSGLSFLIIIVLLVAVYFFFLRPRQQRAKAQAGKGKTFGIGDEVMSVGGIFGRVVGLGDESVDVEVAPGIVLTFLRRAVNPRPPSALSNTAPQGGSVTDRDDGAHPYGGSTADPGSFAASSGHFAGTPEDRDGAEEGFDDDEGFDDEEAEDGEEVTGEAGEMSENGHQPDDHGSTGGSATGTPRTTGGSRSEED